MRTSPDPLYEPIFVILIYGLWVIATSLVNPPVGAGVLVMSTATWLYLSLRSHRAPEVRAIRVDVGTLILFVATGICATALVFGAYETSPRFTVAALIIAAMAFATTVVVQRRRLGRARLATTPAS